MFGKLFKGIRKGISKVFKGLKKAVKGIKIKDVLKVVGTIGVALVAPALLGNMMTGLGGAMASSSSALVSTIGNGISALGTAIAGPFGALLGGPFGRIGDLGDMEDALGMQKTRGFFGSLGHGLGLGQSLDEQMMDYYGIPDYSTQSFTEQLEEDALDFEADIDPYSALSDAFGPGDMSGDMGEAYDESDPGEMSDEGETDEF